MRTVINCFIAFALILLFAIPPWTEAQEAGSAKAFRNEELDQMLAPIALYPDSLLAQMMMASTYPLQIVQADRFVKQHTGLKSEQLMEKAKNENWDPSVKSLLAFPDVLGMMSEKLDWTTKLGDAFLSQQKDVMDSIQRLRWKAKDSGNLKTSKEQQVIVEKETIVIQPASPQVVYVPAYNPTVVYGAWAYPAYPPYPYYPPGYGAAAATFGFVAGVAVGSAAWGNWNWHHGEVDVDVNHYNNFTKNNYTGVRAEQYRQNTNAQRQSWQHNPQNRQGVAYRDQTTAQRYNRASSPAAAQSRQAYRGRTEQGAGVQRTERGGGAFSGMDRGGNTTRDFSNRGSSSRQSMSAGSRGGGFRGGGRGGGRR